MRFNGRTALITGAGSGIGAAVAERMAGEGARLALCGRRREPLEEVARRCLAKTDRALAIPMDVREPQSVGLAFERAVRELGALGCLIACHGTNQLSRVETMDPEAWRDVIATNLTGTFYTAREAARLMRPRGEGRIVVVGSVSGRPGYTKYPGFAAYAASKYALTGLIEVMAAELEGSGIGLAMICPGGVDTEMFRRTFPDDRPSLTAERVALAILDLADPASASPQGTIVDLV